MRSFAVEGKACKIAPKRVRGTASPRNSESAEQLQFFEFEVKVAIFEVTFSFCFQILSINFFYNKVFVFWLEGPLKTSIFAEGFPSLKNFKIK